ncbi:MAG TPA: dethiobiotin synthase, partial [Chromatiales bacterium]|nr:dethiobiotin synthase [Chromatiales bacterium]
LSTLGLKPVAAGCAQRDGMWVNEDALALQVESDPVPEYPIVNPVALELAAAPHIAATAVGRRLVVSELADHCEQALQSGPAEFAVVEGAGGWFVPLNDVETMADLAGALKLPVIMVVGMRLGCLNHALLTAAAISATGLPLTGWVANFPAPMREAKANVDSLRSRLSAPCLGCIPALGEAPDASDAARHLQLDLLPEIV